MKPSEKSKINPAIQKMAHEIYHTLVDNKFTSLGELERICERAVKEYIYNILYVEIRPIKRRKRG